MIDNEIIKTLESCLDIINRQKAEIETMQNAARAYETAYHRIKSEAIKDFSERLCKGRVSNDPVVIAVQVELEEMDGGER